MRQNFLFENIERTANISPCGQYRYSLGRKWGDGPCVCFVMLNPSSADALVDDPTLRRCMGYAQAWGYSALEVRNLFALRSTNPRYLMTHADPVGPQNDAMLAQARFDLLVCAWGTGGSLFGRDRKVLAMLAELGQPLHCLGTTAAGHPLHPLYLRNGLVPLPFPPGVNSPEIPDGSEIQL